MVKFSNDIQRIEPSGIRKIFDRAKELERDRKIIHFEIGRPDYSLPDYAKEAIYSAAEKGLTHYTPNKGPIEVLESLSKYIEENRGLMFYPENEMLITTGLSESIAATFFAFVNPGDEVIIPTPAWPHYKNLTLFRGAIPIEVPLKPDENYQLQVSRVAKKMSPKTKLVIFNNPCNPTGAIHPAETINELISLCKKNDCLLISDEIYEDFIPEGSELHTPALEDNSKNHCLFMSGISKTFGATGLRVGYTCGHEKYISQITKAHQYLTVCTSSLSLFAAQALFQNKNETREFKEKIRKEYQSRLEIVKDKLKAHDNLDIGGALGAMYVFLQYPKQMGSSIEICNNLLENKGVATVPGIVFGNDFDHHLRLAYTSKQQDLSKGLDLIIDFFK